MLKRLKKLMKGKQYKEATKTLSKFYSDPKNKVFCDWIKEQK